jgi:hypothetical protein
MVEGFNFVLGLLVEPLVVLGDAIGVPDEDQILICPVDLLHGGTGF